MIPPRFRRLVLLLALLGGAIPAGLARSTQDVSAKNAYFEGQVMQLGAVLAKHGAKLDPDVAAQSLVLVTAEGKIYTLVKDDGSRMFFMDKSLRERPMRLTARQIAQSHLLQVIQVQSYIKGQLHDVYYWCETCSIRDSEPGDCHCCGDKFEFRETPVK